VDAGHALPAGQSKSTIPLGTFTIAGFSGWCAVDAPVLATGGND
jgi:hypothetical protein